ncbi:CYFA0S01e08944g1_1 [Cyberlindnera fabianii]|uniref:CYFA0S01e08944g1_1 n=1 Tax=Cyberlindnera fabianii TaxID=36022 RepID=A0A061AI61_CYBFA|nr:KIN17-like protein [Cyberlindnera fabianii]CDR37253.1 CYFA0S01e08944g1_1 [Cyberlindnera fabianii]
MAKAEFGTPKYLANQMKMKGLQKLKWYCQVCEKQCRDDNGFKCHIRSEAHLKKIQNVGKDDIEKYSKQFQDQFVFELRNYHGEKNINANRFYNQLIQQKDHVHLNATKWSSLSQFIKHLAQQGIIKAHVTDEGDDSMNGVDIAYINNSGDEVMRKVMLKKKEQLEKSDEQLSQKLLEHQIRKGQKDAPVKEKQEEEEEDLTVKKSDTPIKISLGGIKKPETAFKKVNAFKVGKPNPLKTTVKKNVFK